MRFYGPEIHRDNSVRQQIRLVSQDDMEKLVARAHEAAAEAHLGLKIDEFGKANVPRNAPCHCGSGHKFKKCCGK